MSAIKKAAEMLRREAESMKACHTVGVGGEWYGESAKAEYDEMIAVAAAALAERDELLVALKSIEEYWNQDQNETAMADACWHAINTARAAITRATGEQP